MSNFINEPHAGKHANFNFVNSDSVWNKMIQTESSNEVWIILLSKFQNNLASDVNISAIQYDSVYV